MYSYQAERANVFTESGQEMFLKIRDKSKVLLSQAGAFRMSNVMHGCSGSTWTMLACVDRLVELKEITELQIGEVAGQDRVFVSARE
jgi:hypothetical protein